MRATIPNRDATVSAPTRWVSPLRPRPTSPRARLVAFAHSASGPNALLPLLSLLPDDVELMGATLPGRERRFGEPFDHLLADPGVVAREVCVELEAMPPSPTVLFGHSLGASIAAAVALDLARPCEAIVLSATPLTGKPTGEGPIESEADLLDVVIRGGGTPAELLEDDLLRSHILALLQVDLRLGELIAQANVGRRLPTTPIVLGGCDDLLVPAPEMVTLASAHDVPTGPVLMPGGHFYLLDDVNRHRVAAILSDALDAACRQDHTR